MKAARYGVPVIWMWPFPHLSCGLTMSIKRLVQRNEGLSVPFPC